ncbi:RNA-dependent RNA polymerase [Armillaria mellea ourmia-like virus 1]|uniref:RNA-dependent RNA polymerase n=1 Tax=Armillaria mellea ourmia-like virus 1 TaxID=2827437 RepID=A0ABX7YJ36_9VIRU|nr:RNA-dependent RNA polymerase [Armillaria mellea ourmia-like virus 1]QUD20355.1 RNA-dependent RNA polymerase [Armillaria mellea ourmia-like virus 1]
MAGLPTETVRYCSLLGRLPVDVYLLIESFIPDEDSVTRDCWARACGGEYDETLFDIISKRIRSSKYERIELELAQRQFDLFIRPDMQVHNPWKPGPIREEAVTIASIEVDLEDHMRRLRDDPESEELDSLVSNDLRQLKIHQDRYFTHFLHAIGIETEGIVAYDKAASTRALAGAIGEMGKRGDGVFRYPGIRPLFFSDEVDAARAFSIYLGRKGLGIFDPRDTGELTQAFYERVGSPAPTLSPAQQKRKDLMLDLLRKTCRHIFRKPKSFTPRAPNSGKACLEVPRSKGGKRAALYLREPGGNTGFTRADTIFSGGKPRTITVSSVWYQKYSWWNEFMFSRIRDAKWCLAGRTVRDWVSEIDLGPLPEGMTFLSGDLKAATDMLSGDFAEVVISHLCNEFNCWNDYDRIVESITRCKFEHRDVDGSQHIFFQLRGQMMGSDFSFPILCLVGWLILVELFDMTEWFLDPRLKGKRFRDAFYAFDKGGINGDDLITWLPEARTRRWAETVALTGGVPEPAKSPCDPVFWTVNSKLWCSPPGGVTHEVGFISPAMILHLHKGQHSAPSEQWHSLLGSELLADSRCLNALELDVILLPELPRSWGGLGLMLYDQPRFCEFMRQRITYAKTSMSLSWLDMDQVELPLARRDVMTANRSSGLVGVSYVKDEKRALSKVTGWVPRELLKNILANRFGMGRVVAWTCPGRPKPKWWEQRKVGGIYHRLFTDRYVWNRVLQELYQTLNHERQGYALVYDFTNYEGDIQLDPLPRGFESSEIRPRSAYTRRQTLLQQVTARKRAFERKVGTESSEWDLGIVGQPDTEEVAEDLPEPIVEDVADDFYEWAESKAEEDDRRRGKRRRRSGMPLVSIIANLEGADVPGIADQSGAVKGRKKGKKMSVKGISPGLLSFDEL